MNRMMHGAAPLLALCAVACGRPSPFVQSTSPSAPSAAVKSIMRPPIQAKTEPVPAAPAAPKQVTILFAYDGAVLDDAARVQLDRLAREPATARSAALVIRGHTDAAGSDRANLRISMARATAVRKHLAAAHVSVPMTLIALGERRPVRPGATLDGADDPAGRAANRRVEITLR